MRNLIITQTIGEGHNFIARAIESALTLRGEECRVIQLFGYSEKEVARQNNLFLNAIKFFPHVYEYFWEKLRERKSEVPNFFIKRVIKKCSKYLLKEISEYSPDKIICTHNNAGAIISYFKKNNKISPFIKTFGIATDFCAYPGWESCVNLDYLFTPHLFTNKEYIEKGFKETQLLAYGIPVAPKFFYYNSKSGCRKFLNLPKDKFTISIVGGGNCLTKASSLLKQILKSCFDIQIVVVTGKNEKEYLAVEKIIKKYNTKNVLNIGFCDCMEKVYTASDLIFTRAGGSTISEQITKQVPIVFRENLIINERINKKLFVSLGAGVSMGKISDAAKILQDVLKNRNLLKNIKNCQKTLKQENSTFNIADFIIKTS
ncbi:MAG: hypothetical protein J6Q32_00970 [Clostridia bacterium]|nr:hypothetical protein [Clostridia bacterium]